VKLLAHHRFIQISFEKVLLSAVILFIWGAVLILGKILPHTSATLLVVCFMLLYTLASYLATVHHRRKMARQDMLLFSQMDYQPTVSVIVPAHNEESVIEKTVENLLALDYPHYDLWVFDDRSKDGTVQVLEGLARKYPEKFHYVVRAMDATPGKSAVLNDALALTTGDILAVFDADAHVDADFLQKTLPYFSVENVGAVQARKVILNAGVNTLTRCQHHEYMLDAHFQSGRDAIRGAVELRGNGQLAKREALLSVKGWNEETITDDLDLSTKFLIAGWDIRFAQNTQVREEGILRFKPLLRQRRRWAEGSLKRYLEHALPMFTSPEISKRASMDMLAYFLEFAFPIWVTADLTIQTLNLFVHDWPNHLFSSLVVLPLISLFFISNLFVAIWYYEHPGWVKSVLYAIETSLFLTLVWVPVVMWITIKVLWAKDEGPLNWGKTEHLGTQAFVRRSRMARFKRLLQRSKERALALSRKGL